MSQVVTTESTQVSDEIIHDKHALEIKHKVMDKMKWNALFNSVSEVCKFVAGPLIGVGIGLASGAMMPAAIAAFIVSATLLAVGVASGYASSRIWQSGQFDNFEINAQSTARHLVQELKTSHMVTENYPGNVRGDGKEWAVATGKKQAPQQSQTQTPQLQPQT